MYCVSRDWSGELVKTMLYGHMTDTVFSQLIPVLIQQPISFTKLTTTNILLGPRCVMLSWAHLTLVAITSMDLSGITPTGVASGGLPCTLTGIHPLCSIPSGVASQSQWWLACTLHPSFSIPPVVTCRGKATTLFSLNPILNWPGNETGANTMAHRLMRLNIEQLGTRMGQPWNLIIAVL